MQSSRAPWATLLIIFINIAAAFGALFDPTIADRFGFSSTSPAIHNALLSLFLHENILHLLGNMVFLAAVGPAVEFSTGAARFLTIFVVSGIIGCAAHWLFFQHSESLLIGASGAVAGLVGYASVRYLRYKVPLAPKLALPVSAIVLIWLGLQVLGVFVRIGDTGGGTAFWSHIGGFLAGLMLSLIFKAPAMESLQTGHEILDAMNDRSPDARLAAANRHLQMHPDDRRALWQKADALNAIGDKFAEGTFLIEMLKTGVGESDAAAIIRKLHDAGQLSQLSPIKKLQLADRFRNDDPAVARLLLRSFVVSESSDSRVPDALLTLATLDAESDPQSSKKLLLELSEKHPLSSAAELARARGLIS